MERKLGMMTSAARGVPSFVEAITGRSRTAIDAGRAP
jgi:hypothetical protein